jgi:hypothetical protein
MEDLIYIIRKDGSGGILGYSQTTFDNNDMARNEYRLATKEEIGKYFDVIPEEKEEIKDEAAEIIEDKNDFKKIKKIKDEL